SAVVVAHRSRVDHRNIEACQVGADTAVTHCDDNTSVSADIRARWRPRQRTGAGAKARPTRLVGNAEGEGVPYIHVTGRWYKAIRIAFVHTGLRCTTDGRRI